MMCQKSELSTVSSSSTNELIGSSAPAWCLVEQREDLRQTRRQRVFDTVWRLNDTAIRLAQSSQLVEASQVFDSALAQLGGLVLHHPKTTTTTSCNMVAPTEHRDPSGTASRREEEEEDLPDHRLEYDEGWDSCTGFISFGDVIDNSMVGSVCTTEMSVVLLFNMGQVLFLRDRGSKDSIEVFSKAFHLAQALPTRTSLLPIRILQMMGYIQYWNREINESIRTFKQSLAYGCWKLSTATSLNCLGVLHFHLPKPDTEKSLDYLLRALAIQRQVLGPEHHTVATSLNNIGRVHFTAERLDEALAAYNQALQMRRTILGNDHRDVAATIYNAGQTYHQMGQNDKALERYKEFVRITLLHKPNRYLVVVLKTCAHIYHGRRDYKNAMSYFMWALKVGRDILGMHADVASIYNKLGNVYYEMGDFDSSLRMYQEGLKCERSIFDPNHPNIVVTLSNIAQIKKQHKGDMAAALSVYKEVLAIQRKTCERSDPSLSVTLSNMGLIYYQTKKYLCAIEMYQESLRIRREFYGEDSLDVASVLNSIGLVLFRIGLSEMALQSFQKSLKIRRDLQGELHHDVAIILSNIATIHLEIGNEDLAIAFYREALRVEKKALGPLHNDVVSTLQYLALVHQKRCETDLALECYLEVLGILKVTRNSTASDDASMARMLNTIANLQLQRGNAQGAMDAIAEAVRIVRRTPASGEVEEREIKLLGFDFYGLAKLYPEAAAAA